MSIFPSFSANKGVENKKTKIYRRDLKTGKEELMVMTDKIVNYALFPDDSIYLDDSLLTGLEIDPSGRYAIGTYRENFEADYSGCGGFFSYFILRFIPTGKLIPLPDSLKPPKGWLNSVYVGYPCWLPEGDAILFGAIKVPYDPPSVFPYNLWVLENLFEQIGGVK